MLVLLPGAIHPQKFSPLLSSFIHASAQVPLLREAPSATSSKTSPIVSLPLTVFTAPGQYITYLGKTIHFIPWHLKLYLGTEKHLLDE